MRLRERTPSASLVCVTTVVGWSLKFHKRSADGSGKCNIVESDDTVFLAIFDIDESEKPELDKAEGLNYGYEELMLELPDLGECYCYVASGSHIDDGLRPYSWYKELVAIGLKYHGAPKNYLAKLDAVDALRDPDRARHDKGMAILKNACQQLAGNPNA